MFYVLLFWTSLKDVLRERERRQEAIPTASRIYRQKKRIKQKLLAVACLLLLISNLLLPSTVYHMLLYLQDLCKKIWACYVKELLRRNGCGDVWLQQNVGHLNRFVSVFRDCWISSNKTGVLVSFQRNALNFIQFSNKVYRQRCI